MTDCYDKVNTYLNKMSTQDREQLSCSEHPTITPMPSLTEQAFAMLDDPLGDTDDDEDDGNDTLIGEYTADIEQMLNRCYVTIAVVTLAILGVSIYAWVPTDINETTYSSIFLIVATSIVLLYGLLTKKRQAINDWITMVHINLVIFVGAVLLHEYPRRQRRQRCRNDRGPSVRQLYAYSQCGSETALNIN